jgi:hypothetical protein
VRLHFPLKVDRWHQLAQFADDAGMGQTRWAKAMRAVVRKERWRQVRNRLQSPFVPLRDRIRMLTRGTTLGRHEIARRRSHAVRADQR